MDTNLVKNNLSNSVSIVAYEVFRHTDFTGLEEISKYFLENEKFIKESTCIIFIEQEINKVGPCSILVHYPVDFLMWKKNRNR